LLQKPPEIVAAKGFVGADAARVSYVLFWAGFPQKVQHDSRYCLRKISRLTARFHRFCLTAQKTRGIIRKREVNHLSFLEGDVRMAPALTPVFVVVVLAMFTRCATTSQEPSGGEQAPMTFKTQTVTVRQDTTIAYWETGTVDAPVVVYVHGNTGSRIWFERAMAVDGYRVIAPDLPNFGESDALDTADIDIYADYLAAFLAELKVSQVYLVGHSLGGAVAISLTVRYPELVARLLLVDSASLQGLHTPEEYYPVIEQYQSNRALMRQALGAVTPTMEDPEYLDRLTDTAMGMNPIAFTGNPRALDRFNYADRVADVTIPVLVVRGEHDALITDDMAQSTADAFPRGVFRRLDGVGHSVMVEDPERFLALVQEFGR
jgi:branched-chain amino acid transport system permease protein